MIVGRLVMVVIMGIWVLGNSVDDGRGGRASHWEALNILLAPPTQVHNRDGLWGPALCSQAGLLRKQPFDPLFAPEQRPASLLPSRPWSLARSTVSLISASSLEIGIMKIVPGRL